MSFMKTRDKQIQDRNGKQGNSSSRDTVSADDVLTTTEYPAVWYRISSRRYFSANMYLAFWSSVMEGQRSHTLVLTNIPPACISIIWIVKTCLYLLLYRAAAAKCFNEVWIPLGSIYMLSLFWLSNLRMSKHEMKYIHNDKRKKVDIQNRLYHFIKYPQFHQTKPLF